MCTHEPCEMGLADLALGGRGAGAGQWAPAGGAGKKRIGVPGHGFTRVSASVFLSSCLARPGFFQGGAGPPAPSPPFLVPCPLSPAGLALAQPSPLCLLGFLAELEEAPGTCFWSLTSGGWWKKHPRVGAGSRRAWRMGLARPPAAHIQPQGLWLPGLLPATVASVSTSFVFLASCALPRPRFPGLEMDQWAALSSVEGPPLWGPRALIVYMC